MEMILLEELDKVLEQFFASACKQNLSPMILKIIIKCPSKCARCDWSVRVHYNSIKYECIRHARALSSYNARCLRHEL